MRLLAILPLLSMLYANVAFSAPKESKFAVRASQFMCNLIYHPPGVVDDKDFVYWGMSFSAYSNTDEATRRASYQESIKSYFEGVSNGMRTTPDEKSMLEAAAANFETVHSLCEKSRKLRPSEQSNGPEYPFPSTPDK